jgi:glycosyltransferase involved in cell wall biosynthesis
MALLESYASRLPLRLMRQRRNLGIVRNTLAAFRAARGAYALYLADDDRLVPEVLVLDDPPTRLFLTDDEAPRDRLLAAGLMPGHVLLLGDLLDQFRVLPRQFVG